MQLDIANNLNSPYTIKDAIAQAKRELNYSNGSSSGLDDFFSKLAQSFEAVFYSPQLYADVGFGFGATAEFCEILEVDAVAKMSPIAIKMDANGFDIGNVRGFEAGVGVSEWDLFSTGAQTYYSYITKQEQTYMDDSCVIGFSAGAYFGIGGSFQIGINLDYIVNEFNRIWFS